MCLHYCLSKKNFSMCRCIPLWPFYVLVMLLTFIENILYLINPPLIVLSAFQSLVFLGSICQCRSVKLKVRNCIWISYLITALLQLFIALVVFALKVAFPDDEECTATTNGETGEVTYDCVVIEEDESVRTETILLIFVLICYFIAKVSCLVCFLHAFARKAIWDEKQIFKRKEEREKLYEIEQKKERKAKRAQVREE